MNAAIHRTLRRLATSAIASSESRPNLLNTSPPHLAYILLRSSEPISSFPSRHTTPLQRALQLNVTQWGGLVNWAYYPDEENSSHSDSEVSAKAFFSSGMQVDIPSLTLENVDFVAASLKQKVDEGHPLVRNPDTYVYVCTHGARDCRCGTTGGLVAQALRNEIRSRKLGRIKVGEVAHVGGHQYAANILVYPLGEWLGYITPDDAPMVIDRIVDTSSYEIDENHPPLSPPHWRGRMGYSKAKLEESVIGFNPTPRR